MIFIMKKIKLVIFNEIYWDNGLIYTQNILPILKMQKLNCHLTVISFTSFLMLFTSWKERRAFKCKMKSCCVDIYDLPILFVPSRLFIVRWFLYPFLLLNTFIYMLIFNLIDWYSAQRVVYVLRSYNVALSFLSLYFGKKTLIFDARTDFIIEQRKIGSWKKNSLSDKFWLSVEAKLLRRCDKTIFISDIFKSEVLLRHNLSDNMYRYRVYYNTVDYVHFEKCDNNKSGFHFLYTGSLANWNNLELYLDFFLDISSYLLDSNFYIVTTTNLAKIGYILKKKKYRPVLNRIILRHNIAYEELPIYYKECSFGLQLMSTPDSRVGVKFVEYMAAGLIPIVSANVKGAAYLCDKYEVGVIIDNNKSVREIVDAMKVRSSDPLKKDKYDAMKKIIDLNSSYMNLYNIYFG